MNNKVRKSLFPSEINTKFVLKKMILENNYWSLMLELISSEIRKLHLHYDADFIADDSGFDRMIESERQSMREIKIDPQQDMFIQERTARLEKHENNIKDIEKNRKEFLENNPNLKFRVAVVEFKNKNDMIVTFRIPDNIVEFINKKKFNIADNYILKLSTEVSEEIEVDEQE